MRQLTSLDTQFLALENSRQSGHVAGLAVLDPSTTPSGALALADIQDLIAKRLPLLPPLRWRLAEVPFGLDYPYWVTPTGSTTPASISTFTSASWPFPSPVRTSSWLSRSPGSPRGRSIAPGRSGSSI